MIIKRAHPFVNPSGLVSIRYLQDWIYPSSNLVDLCRDLSQYFGRDPPLYSQRRPNPSPSPNANPIPNPGYIPPNHGVGSSQFARPAIPPRTYPQSPYGSGRILVQGPSARTEDPTEVFKRNTISKLVESVHNDMGIMRKNREAEMEGLINGQTVLRQREEHISNGLREMQNEKEGLEQQLQMASMNADVLESWLRDNEEKLGSLGNVDIDEAFHHCDVLSKQMLDSTSSDLAIEDTIYALDKAVQEGSIQFDQYLRNVRLLSREQFFHRATSSKIRAAQMQAQVTNMAARMSQYVG
jgi:ESCRT-I complex subunit TSG101